MPEHTLYAGWGDLDFQEVGLLERRLVTPPAGLLAALRMLPRADGFRVLPPVARADHGRA